MLLIIIILAILMCLFLALYVKWKVAYRKLLRKSLQSVGESSVLVQTVDFSTLQTGSPSEEKMLVELQKLMEEGKVYLEKDLTIVRIAKQLGTNRATLSHLINSKMNKNFPTLINEYRVKEAVRLLSDPETCNHKMEVIGDMCGYKNRQVFHSAFKKETGVTPNQFREMGMGKMG